MHKFLNSASGSLNRVDLNYKFGDSEKYRKTWMNSYAQENKFVIFTVMSSCNLRECVLRTFIPFCSSVKRLRIAKYARYQKYSCLFSLFCSEYSCRELMIFPVKKAH